MQVETIKQDDVMEEKKLKILMSAYSITPGLPSEPGVGWNNVIQAARFHEVWVITSEGNRKSIEAEIAVNPLPDVHWVYVNLPEPLPRFISGEKGGRVHYYFHQIAIYQAAKKLVKEVNFDLVHHINYVSYWTPVFLSRLPAPFIWGPVGGAESAPTSFYKTLNARGVLFERIRDTVRWFAHHFDPFVAETARNSALAYATTKESLIKMQDVGTKNVEVLPAICMTDEDLDRLLSLPLSENRERISFISIGRFIAWKGYHMGLEAFARFHKEYPDSEYVIVGDGPQEGVLKSLVSELGIEDAVIFTGRIPHSEVMQKLGESDVMVHPSLHDSGGVTCLEAMAGGRAVLCLDLGGPALLTTEETGIVASAESPEKAVDEMVAAMHRFANNPDERLAMGKKGREHVLEHYTWEKRGDFFKEVYKNLVKTVKQ